MIINISLPDLILGFSIGFGVFGIVLFHKARDFFVDVYNAAYIFIAVIIDILTKDIRERWDNIKEFWNYQDPEYPELVIKSWKQSYVIVASITGIFFMILSYVFAYFQTENSLQALFVSFCADIILLTYCFFHFDFSKEDCKKAFEKYLKEVKMENPWESSKGVYVFSKSNLLINEKLKNIEEGKTVEIQIDPDFYIMRIKDKDYYKKKNEKLQKKIEDLQTKIKRSEFEVFLKASKEWDMTSELMTNRKTGDKIWFDPFRKEMKKNKTDEKVLCPDCQKKEEPQIQKVSDDKKEETIKTDEKSFDCQKKEETIKIDEKK